MQCICTLYVHTITIYRLIALHRRCPRNVAALVLLQHQLDLEIKSHHGEILRKYGILL